MSIPACIMDFCNSLAFAARSLLIATTHAMELSPFGVILSRWPIAVTLHAWPVEIRQRLAGGSMP
jgi:hypothetical protein